MKNILFKNWKTTLVGVLAALLSLFVALGKITSDEQTQLMEWAGELIAIGTGLFLMFFAKDTPTNDEPLED